MIFSVVNLIYLFKVVPRGRRAEADAEIILYNNLLASLARKSNPRARASTGRSRQGHCAPPSPSGIPRRLWCTVHRPGADVGEASPVTSKIT